MSKTVTIEKDGVVARIDAQGAQLRGLAKGGLEYLWQSDSAWWGKSSPVLFPVVGAAGRGPVESAAGMCNLGKHGFARDMEHAVKEVAEDGSSVTFELVDTEETRAAYPYRFILNMTYAITGPATLTQTFSVTNAGDVPMPFSAGGHPAFNVPAPGTEGEAFDDYELRFTRPWTADSPTMVEGGMLTYENSFRSLDDADVLPITRELFDCDTVVLSDVPGNTIELVSRKSGRGVRLVFDGFKFVGIWSAQPDAPFVAVEPWTGHAALAEEDDVFEHRDNVTILEPGETDTRSFSMTLL